MFHFMLQAFQLGYATRMLIATAHTSAAAQPPPPCAVAAMAAMLVTDWVHVWRSHKKSRPASAAASASAM
jgi:hypothetical protein